MPLLSSQFEHFYPVVCLSASKYTSGGSSERYGNFNYVPGSGDDHEGWVPQGFGPQMFWENKEEILACNRDQLYRLMENLALKSTKAECNVQHKRTAGNAKMTWIIEDSLGYLTVSRSTRQAAEEGSELSIYIGSTWTNPDLKANHVFAVPQDPKKHLQYFTIHIEEIERSIAQAFTESRPVRLIWLEDSTSNERDFGIGILLVALCTFRTEGKL